jgi:hypothetical protein
VGVFRQLKDMTNTVHDAPVRVEQAQQMAVSAQSLSTVYPSQATSATQAPAAPSLASGATAGADFEPIAAVSLELYAQISKSLATIDYDLSRSIRLAGDKGVSEESWTVAVEGWNARMAANPAVGTRFSALYAAS